MWSLIKNTDSFITINKNLLPILMANDFDLYFNGHEHLSSFAYFKQNANFTMI